MGSHPCVTMDFLNNLTGKNNAAAQPTPAQQAASPEQHTGQGSGVLGSLSSKLSEFGGGGKHTEDVKQNGNEGFMAGLMNKANEAAGGGVKGEQKEDGLDKAIDFVQEKVLGQGPQNNESAMEQKQDEMISDMIRGQYKTATGKEFFVKDK